MRHSSCGELDRLPDVDTAFVHVAGKAGGPILFVVMNTALLVANMGSGTAPNSERQRLLYGMGRDGACPLVLRLHRPRPTSRATTVVFVGVLALIGGFVLSYQLGAEMLNFGAFIAFAGVNLAALAHYGVRSKDRKWHDFVLPLLGFLICAYLWWSLRPLAKIAGGSWLAVGILYGLIRTRGFKQNTTSFEAPPE